MNTIIINGKKFEVSGSNISVKNNTVYVDGKEVHSNLNGDIHINFEGDLASLNCNASATVKGTIYGAVDVGGSLQCGDIVGDVDAGGSVQCGKVTGDVDAGGSITMRK